MATAKKSTVKKSAAETPKKEKKSPPKMKKMVVKQPSAAVEEELFEASGEELICHGAFAGEHVVNVFLDGSAADERVDDDWVLLADSVGAVAGLVFYGGVPPAVEVDDVARACEGKPGTCRFE